MCKHYSFIGSREFGSFAEYVTVPEKNAVKFEDEVSFEQGAFFEPATVALHGLNRVDYHAGECVAILGGEPSDYSQHNGQRFLEQRKLLYLTLVQKDLN